MQKDGRHTIKNLVHILSVPYGVLFIIVLLMSAFSLTEIFNILGSSPDSLKNYPFGTEHGFSYCSRETYLATNLMMSFIGFQSLVTSFLFCRFNHKMIGITVLFLPLLLNACLVINFGNFN